MLKKLAEFWDRISNPPVDTVAFDEEGVTRTMASGRIEHVRWDHLVEIEIVTTDEGPFVEDVFWLLSAGDGTGCAVPQGAVGSDALLARLQQLPGFDNGAVIDAMTCVENARFVCWRATPPRGTNP
jgi:hypothetical protein